MKETSMAEELLSLKWNNHQAHFVDILTFLRDQEIFVDATLACGGKLYPAHKFVLSTCSDYFKQMFTKSPNKHPIVFMKDVTARDLEALLDFMYNGEVNVPQSSLGSLIKTAEGLQIKGLAVPDDPPVAKREKEVNRDRRDSYNSREYIRSPPSKRMRLRDRSPTRNSATNNAVISKPKSSNASSEGQPLEAALDEDSRTSVHSGVSDSNNQLQNSKSSVSQSQVNSDSTSHADPLQAQTQSEEPSPGPSGLQRSKEEEMEIKQEDVVDLGDEEEGDWPGDTEGMDGAGDGGDSSMGSDNAQGFPEVLLPHADGGLGAATGDQAMVDLLPGKFSPFVSPLLLNNLEGMMEWEVMKMKTRLCREVIEHLDANGLITQSDRNSRSLLYNQLGQQVWTRYPNIAWDIGGARRQKKFRHVYGPFIAHLANLRRCRKFRERRKAFVTGSDNMQLQHDLNLSDI